MVLQIVGFIRLGHVKSGRKIDKKDCIWECSLIVNFGGKKAHAFRVVVIGKSCLFTRAPALIPWRCFGQDNCLSEC